MKGTICDDVQVKERYSVLQCGCSDGDELDTDGVRCEEQEILTSEDAQAIYDELRERFEEEDEVYAEEISYEICKYLPAFFRFNVDLHDVAEMLTPIDLAAHYDELRNYGTIPETSDFIRSELAINFENACTLLNNGTSPKMVLGLIREWFFLHNELSEGKSTDLLMCLYDYGLSTEEIRNFIEINMSESVLHDMFIRNPEKWEYVGIHIEDYSQMFLKSFGREYFSLQSVEKLPSCISTDEFIEFFNMNDILRYTRERGFFNFLLEIDERGADMELVLQKFLKDIGYSGFPIESDAMFDLLIVTSPDVVKKLVDIDEFARLVDADALSRNERHFYGYWLEGWNVSSLYRYKFCT